MIRKGSILLIFSSAKVQDKLHPRAALH